MRRIQPASMKQRPSLQVQLDGLVDEFDQLLGDVHLGIRSPARFDDLEDRADGIATRLRAAFRSERVHGLGGQGRRA